MSTPAERDSTALTALPHSGLPVPHARLRVSSRKKRRILDGCRREMQAILRLDNKIVGTIEDEGRGGGPRFCPHLPTVFGYPDLNAFAAACRNADGQPVGRATVLNDLLEKYETDRWLTKYSKLGWTSVRLLAPLAEDAPELWCAERAAVGGVEVADQGAIAVELRPPRLGERWQVWAGEAWEDLPASAGATKG